MNKMLQRIRTHAVFCFFWQKKSSVWLGDGCPVVSGDDGEGPCSEAQARRGAALYVSSSRLDDARGSTCAHGSRVSRDPECPPRLAVMHNPASRCPSPAVRRCHTERAKQAQALRRHGGGSLRIQES